MAELKENNKETNEYILVVAKKIRNLGKKINNIKEIEKKVANKEPINDEQKLVLANKDFTFKFYEDLVSVRNQMNEIRAKEVALEEKNKKLQKQLEPSVKSELKELITVIQLNSVLSNPEVAKKVQSEEQNIKNLTTLTSKITCTASKQSVDEAVNVFSKFLVKSEEEFQPGVTFKSLHDGITSLANHVFASEPAPVVPHPAVPESTTTPAAAIVDAPKSETPVETPATPVSTPAETPAPVVPTEAAPTQPAPTNPETKPEENEEGARAENGRGPGRFIKRGGMRNRNGNNRPRPPRNNNNNNGNNNNGEGQGNNNNNGERRNNNINRRGPRRPNPNNPNGTASNNNNNQQYHERRQNNPRPHHNNNNNNANAAPAVHHNTAPAAPAPAQKA